MLLEGRAPLEFFSLFAALPWLARLPRGDGHPVIVFPGMAAGDLTTMPLRRFLRSLGYVTQAWGQGLNFGPRPGVLERSADDLRELAEKHGQPVSLIGWSLGGSYARELAKLHPALQARLRTPPPVPTTSIYSRTDGIVSWRCSLNEPGPIAENIAVHGSHLGLGINPLVLYALADRLAQPPGQWKPFDASGARRWFFPAPVSGAPAA